MDKYDIRQQILQSLIRTHHNLHSQIQDLTQTKSDPVHIDTGLFIRASLKTLEKNDLTDFTLEVIDHLESLLPGQLDPEEEILKGIGHGTAAAIKAGPAPDQIPVHKLPDDPGCPACEGIGGPGAVHRH